MRVLFLLLTSLPSIAQITFEKGYVVLNDGNKIECLIKNVDWLYNPTEFVYKKPDNDSLKKGDLSSVKEFGVYGYSKFIRADVKIDRSKVHLQDLSTGRTPKWSREKLFLKILVEGKVNLYSYEDNGFIRFFYSQNDSTFEQLVYRKYLADDQFLKKNSPQRANFNGDLIRENNLFRQQLFNSFRCKNDDLERFKKIKYERNDLVAYFIDYNRCSGDNTVTSHEASDQKKEKSLRNVFNIKVAPGLSNTMFTTYPYSYSGISASDFEFKSTTNFRLGTEFEFIFPFNKNKWSFVFEPTYQTLQSTSKDAEIKLNAIQFPFGFRHYFFLNKDYKIFLNWFRVPKNLISTSYDLNFQYNGQRFEGLIQIGSGFAYGLGAELRRISFEARYYTGTNQLLGTGWSADYRMLSFIAGYKIFKIMK
jgi:hypothetical protein